MVLSLLKILVPLCILFACLSAKAKSAGDSKRISTSTVSEGTDAGQGGCFYQSQVFLDPPEPDSICNCSAIQALMSAEVKDVKGHLSQLQTKVSDQGAMLSSEVEEAKSQLEQLQTEVSDQRTAITSELKETKHQLEQIFEAVLHVGEIVKNSTDNNRLRDCSEAPASGVYTIQPGCSGQKYKVYCDMETDGGGWTVFQRRQDGSVDFYRSFSEYSEGFGDPKGEFWLGNRKIHTLTAHSNYELRVDLTDFEGNSVYALYDSFRIEDLSDNFKLFVEGCSGTAGDSLSYHNGRPFSTKDRDNDDSNESSCAKLWQGAWWYGECYDSNLNGKYLGKADDEAGIVWHAWKPNHYSLKTTEMKMRLRS